MEVRVVSVDGAGTHRLRLSGWAANAPAVSSVTLLAADGCFAHGHTELVDASPAAPLCRIDHVEGIIEGDATVVVALQLGEGPVPIVTLDGRTVTVEWPDGSLDDATLPSAPGSSGS